MENTARVIGLHVLNDQIVRRLSVQFCAEIFEPFLREMDIDRVHNGNLLVYDRVRIIGHAVIDGILSFEQIHLVIVGAYI